MQTSVTFKNLDPSENLKSYVSDKLNRFDKYLDNPAEANVVLSVQKFRHITEISIAGDRLNIIGKEETGDMYSSIDAVIDKIKKQINKSKQKIRERRMGSKSRTKTTIVEETTSVEEEISKEIKIVNIDYKPMDIEEAVMQMELVSDNFLVFSNAKTDRINVLYHRKDGHYGLIQPGK